MRFAHATAASAALRKLKVAMPGEVIDLKTGKPRKALSQHPEAKRSRQRRRDARVTAVTTVGETKGPADQPTVTRLPQPVVTEPVTIERNEPVTGDVTQHHTVIGALCRAVRSGAVLAGCVWLARGSYALLTGVTAYLKIGSDLAVAVLVAEVVAGYFIEERSGKPGDLVKRVCVGLLAACIAVEMVGAVIRENAGMEARAEQAAKDARDRADKEWEQVQKALSTSAAPSIQVRLRGPQGAGAFGDKLNEGADKAAARLETAREKWKTDTDAAVDKAKKQAGQIDWLRMAFQVIGGAICAVAMAIASASGKQFLESLQTVFERLLSLPAALIGWRRRAAA
jgi:hypothetical protein